MRPIFHFMFWFLFYTFMGWFIGSALYWRFTHANLTEAQFLGVFWQDYLFFVVSLIAFRIGIYLTEPKPSS